MVSNQNNANVKESRFDGGLLGLIGTGFLALLAFILSVVVGGIFLAVVFFFGKDLLAGIKDAQVHNIVLYALYGVGAVLALLGVLHGFAAMSTVSLRWTVRHTEINGRRLKFDGKARQLMGNYIKWFLLTVITIGIYSLWLGIKQKQWEVKHTVFADEEQVAADNGYGTNVYVNYAQPQMPMQQMPMQSQAPVCSNNQMCPQMMYGFPPVYPVNPYCNNQNNTNCGK
ncbi:MAG: DUF898 family protein [Clostridia bacterium]|nr:DUF898 family protein [Clostridia bacterium]